MDMFIWLLQAGATAIMLALCLTGLAKLGLFPISYMIMYSVKDFEENNDEKDD